MLKDKILDLLFKEELTQKELTTKLKSSRSRISEVLKSLEERGFIVRRRVSERTVMVSLNHSRTLRIGMLKSAEYVHVVSTLKELGDEIPFRITIYDNSLEALKELITGSEDIVASPLISGYFFYLIDKNVRPIAGVAEGGAGLLTRADHGKIGTTPLSSMDRKSREYRNYEQVYFKSIEDILRAYKNGDIDAAQIWEPFLSMNKGISNPGRGMCCCLFSTEKTRYSVSKFLRRYVKNVERGFSTSEKMEISKSMGKLLGVRTIDVYRSIDSYHFTTALSREDLENQIMSFGLPLVKEVETFLERSAKVPV